MERAKGQMEIPDRTMIEELRAMLEVRERQLRQMIAEEHERATVELMTDLEGVVGDEADQAFAKTRASVETELVDRHLRELGGIEAARERIAAGTFGLCPDCGGAIAPARLRANPAALRCTECQSRHEKMFADVR